MKNGVLGQKGAHQQNLGMPDGNGCKCDHR